MTPTFFLIHNLTTLSNFIHFMFALCGILDFQISKYSQKVIKKGLPNGKPSQF